MAETVRVRFAPSPTGFLHIGGVRAALYNWLFARGLGGQFLLRIEDTDLERSEDRFTQDIMASMKWLGLEWDEEPIFQSKRLDVYAGKAEELIAAGHAYRCTCTEADVEKMRERAVAEGAKPMYDRSCREKGIPKDVGQPFVVRLKVPLGGSVTFTDLIRGDITFENSEIDDFVLIRSNGAPTYNLSVVVDDVHSRMTHVIRGDDHVNNTPKQVHLYTFFKYPQPKFAHLPMILGADKKKLSKRNGVVSANAYRAEGYLPEAMLNFLARIGWSHGDQEVFSVEEMVRHFSFDHVQKASGVFNPEKLLWLNAEHLKKAPPARVAGIVAEDFAQLFQAAGSKVERVRTAKGEKLIATIQPKAKLVKDIADQLVPLCSDGAVEVDASTLKWKDEGQKAAVKAAVRHAIELFGARMAGVSASDPAWGPSLGDAGLDSPTSFAMLQQLAGEHGLKVGEIANVMRLAVSGRAVSAGLTDLLPLLPWATVESRLRKVEGF